MKSQIAYQRTGLSVRPLLLLVCAAALFWARTTLSAPRIACDEPVYDFGNAAVNTSIEHMFTLWNRGNEPLIIGKLRACCGGSMSVASKTIDPGSNTQVKVTLSLNNRNGQQKKSFYIASNDPTQPYFQLRFVGNVSAPATVSPRPVNAEAVEIGMGVVPREILLTEGRAERLTRYLALQSRDQSAFEITGITLPGKDMKSKVTAVSPGAYRLELSDINPVAGLDGKAVIVTTDHPAAGTVEIPFRVIPSGVATNPAAQAAVDTGSTVAEKAAATEPPVVIDYFHEPGCPSCRRIESGILPEVMEVYGGTVELRKWNVSEMEDVIRLMAYQDALGLTENHPVLMVVDYQVALQGVNAIEGGLRKAIETALLARKDAGFAGPVPIAVPDAMDGLTRGQSRLETFSLPAILVAGLIDGLNPCAITGLTFLMSLLAASKVKGRKLLLLGLSYCFASFLTYLTLGLGLLQAFDWFQAMPVVRHVVEMILLAGLLIVAFLSFRDAWRFSRSHKAEAVQVKLPKAVVRLSHTLMRRGVRAKHIVLGGFGAGIAVTVVESICTGQLYVPTLALMIRMADSSQSLRAWQLLLGYNAMFIVPLLIVFLLVWAGLSNQKLQDWSKRHVVPGKILMGLLMLLLAAGLLLLRHATA